MTLWFENSWGEREAIADCNTQDEVFDEINAFIDRVNENRSPDSHPFVIYYIRTWEEDGMTKFDVGSHTEFFLWEGKISH